jgi:carboxylesterase type B
MRAIDAKVLEELEMLYGDKDCFHPLHNWFGTAETYWTNLERLFMVADHAKEHSLSVAEKIAVHNKRIVELFNQTKEYASEWNSKRKEKRGSSRETEDFAEATDERLEALNKWTASQEELRQTILKLVRLLYSIAYEY